VLSRNISLRNKVFQKSVLGGRRVDDGALKKHNKFEDA